jgi:Glycosyltransferase family 10 (fucosyltransferase) C-term
MTKLTIGMASSYVGLNPLPLDWLWHQTPHPNGAWGNIQMVAPAARPDGLLLYQFEFPSLPKVTTWKQQIKAQLRPAPPLPDPTASFRGLPPERLIYLLREPPLPEVMADNLYNYTQAQQYCAYVSGPEAAAPTPDYMPAIWYLNNSFRDLDQLPPPPKSSMCSWVTSGIARTANHRQRLGFAQLLHDQQLQVDLYGRDLPPHLQSRGMVGNKHHAMAPYYYNLTIENYADNDWYVTEKLWDALLSWCLPIYYGGGAADKLLPPGSFLRLPSLDQAGADYIQSVTATPDAWYAAKDAIAEARQIVLHKLNLLNWLAEYADRWS